nr:NAD(P)H-binding protein [Gammaproteobacteria bacterium]
MTSSTGSKDPVLVVGASGRVGGELVRLLSASRLPVRALVRSNAAKAALPDNVDVVVGDLANRDKLTAAVDNVSAVFVGIRDHPLQPEWEGNLIALVADRRDLQYIKLSAFAAGLDPPPGYGRLHRSIELQLVETLLNWTVLRPYMYMQTYLEMADAVRRFGRLPLPLGRARVALVDCRDVARVAAAVLGNDRHRQKIYVLTGAESLAGTDTAQQIAAVTGKKVRYTAMPSWLAGLMMRAGGIGAWD